MYDDKDTLLEGLYHNKDILNTLLSTFNLNTLMTIAREHGLSYSRKATVYDMMDLIKRNV